MKCNFATYATWKFYLFLAVIPIIINPDRPIPASPSHQPPPNAISSTGEVDYDKLWDARYFVGGEERPRVQKTKDRYRYQTLAELHQELNNATRNDLNAGLPPNMMIPYQRNVYGLVVKVLPQKVRRQKIKKLYSYFLRFYYYYILFFSWVRRTRTEFWSRMIRWMMYIRGFIRHVLRQN